MDVMMISAMAIDNSLLVTGCGTVPRICETVSTIKKVAGSRISTIRYDHQQRIATMSFHNDGQHLKIKARDENFSRLGKTIFKKMVFIHISSCIFMYLHVSSIFDQLIVCSRMFHANP